MSGAPNSILEEMRQISFLVDEAQRRLSEAMRRQKVVQSMINEMQEDGIPIQSRALDPERIRQTKGSRLGTAAIDQAVTQAMLGLLSRGLPIYKTGRCSVFQQCPELRLSRGIVEKSVDRLIAKGSFARSIDGKISA